MDGAAVEHTSLVGLLTSMAQHAPVGRVADVGGLRIADTGGVVPLFNAVIARDAPIRSADVADVLDGRRVDPATTTWWVRRGVDVEPVQFLRDRGLQVVDTMPGMLAPLPLAVRPEADVELAVATGDEAFDVHGDLMSRSFGVPVDAAATFTSRGFVADDDVIVSVARVAGRPVSTAIGVMVGGSVCLFNVATPPEERGRGYGAAVTAHAASVGAERGATSAALQSSEIGFSVYRRLGFETVVDYDVWGVT